MPRSNVIHPLFALDKSEHILFRVEKDRLLRVVFSPITITTGVQEAEKEVETSENERRKNTLLIFIHGVGGSLDIWQNQLKACQNEGFNILAVDLLGHGGSSKPIKKERYTFENLARDLLVLFDSYKMKYNYFIGHSYGTSFCTYISVERDSFVHGLVLIAGGSPSPLLPENCSMFNCPLSILKCVHKPLVSHYKRLAFYVKTPGSLVLQNAPIQVSPQVLHAVMQGQIWPDGDEDYHSRLRIPVLIIAGRQDNLVSIQEEEWMHDTLPNSQLCIIEDAGHMVLIEQPNQVSTHLLDFIKEIIKKDKDVNLFSISASCVNFNNNSNDEMKSPSLRSSLSRNLSINSSTRSLRRGKIQY